MTHKTPFPRVLATAISIALLTACGSPPGESDLSATPPSSAPDLPLPKPWTESFRTPAILIADEVRIEGPKGLVYHVAMQVEPDHHRCETKTLPEGFRQIVEVVDPKAGFEITVHLDAYRIAVLHKLVILERPGDVEVIVRAVGDVYWKDLESDAEKHGATLTFRGKPPE
jgi:hypothetical protein